MPRRHENNRIGLGARKPGRRPWFDAADRVSQASDKVS